MKMLCSVKLSPHKYKTPEGYLVCKDAIIARTGSQTYLKSELYPNVTNDDYIEINRSEKEVFDEKTIASFENKPLTIDHPDEPVNPDNYKYLSVGNTFNVRKGDYEGQPVLLADIMVTDAEAIRLIESGEMTELSCGYDCDITDSPNPEQINIRGNHVALCIAGRAGIARIQDSKIKDSKIEGVPPELLLSSSAWFEEKIHIERKYHVKIYNITSNKGLTITGSRQDLEKLCKDYHLEDGYRLKIVDSKIEDDSWYVIYEERFNSYYTGSEWTFSISNAKKYSSINNVISDITKYGITKNTKISVIGSSGKTYAETDRGRIKFYDNEMKDSKEMTMSDAIKMLNIVEDSKKNNKSKFKWIQSINDSSVNKGTLIQEFGKYGKQYKIEKIVGNVIYAKNLVDEKIVLFKKDEENVEWAIITKSDIKDSLKVTYISDNISKLKDELFRALKKFLSKIDEELLDYSGVEIKEIEKNEYKVSVFAELGYKNLMELADILDKIIIKYDEDAYFEAEAPGRLAAYCNISDLRIINKIDTNDIYIEDDIYIIQLDDKINYLDENNKPTKDINKAKKFTSFEEAEEYKNLYCKGQVIKLNKLKNDKYSKKFYSKIIKELENKLDELNNNEYLDTDNFILEKQKNNLKVEIKNQIEEYKNKLNEE